MLSNCSFDFKPRPPETTFPAVAKSGLSDFARFSDIHSVGQAVLGSTPSVISADPSPNSAAANAVPRIVIILIASDDWTVRIAFPAYIGRTKAKSHLNRRRMVQSEYSLSSPSIAVMSDIC